jgi:beta-N-acetylhexosaminidase
LNTFDQFRSLLVCDIFPEGSLPEMRRIRPGGIVVRRRNTTDPARLKKLIRQHQVSSPVPLLVAGNFEWGVANDLKGCSSFFPGMMALAAACSKGGLQLARRQGRAIAREARSLGVNTLFGPVVDVSSGKGLHQIGTRFFSEKSSEVAAFGQAYIKGVQEGGLCATAKHYPGAADPKVDSHLSLPVCSQTLGSLLRTGLVPMRRAIAAGTGAIMVRHAAYPKITGEGTPCTLAPMMIEILRDRLGFEGFTITDNMVMGAIAKTVSPVRALLGPIAAGIDLVLAGNELLTPKNLRACERTIRRDKTLQAQIGAACERMKKHRLKWRMRSAWGTHRELERDSIQLAQKISNKSLKLISDPRGILPINRERYARILVVSAQAADGFHVALRSNFGYFAMAVKEYFPEADMVFTADPPSADDQKRVFSLAKQADAVILVLQREPGVGDLETSRIRMHKKILNRFGPKTVIAGMMSPGVLKRLPRSGAAVFACSSMPMSQKALAEGIVGARKIR